MFPIEPETSVGFDDLAQAKSGGTRDVTVRPGQTARYRHQTYQRCIGRDRIGGACRTAPPAPLTAAAGAAITVQPATQDYGEGIGWTAATRHAILRAPLVVHAAPALVRWGCSRVSDALAEADRAIRLDQRAHTVFRRCPRRVFRYDTNSAPVAYCRKSGRERTDERQTAVRCRETADGVSRPQAQHGMHT